MTLAQETGYAQDAGNGGRAAQPEYRRMSRLKSHRESHLVSRVGWLRAAVLGANDGILSTASLVVGVAAASSGRSEVMIAGLAGLVAGAMSMAAGEYVSVSSQSDTEQADLARERAELRDMPQAELQELAEIYVSRGVEPVLAQEVARQMMAKDALAAHARDELGMTDMSAARPVQAALTSAATFSAGGTAPHRRGTQPPRDDRAGSLAGLTRRARGPRRPRRTGWRRRHDEAGAACHLLGSGRDGIDRSHRRRVRHSRRLIRPTARPSTPRSPPC